MHFHQERKTSTLSSEGNRVPGQEPPRNFRKRVNDGIMISGGSGRHELLIIYMRDTNVEQAPFAETYMRTQLVV